MQNRFIFHIILLSIVMGLIQGETFAEGETKHLNSTESGFSHSESASYVAGKRSVETLPPPALPEGMSLDDVLQYSASEPPEHFPDVIHDNVILSFTMFEQLEYRIADTSGADILGWEAQGWIGTDYNRFWWKTDGESVFDGREKGESENDLLYSRLIAPFWSIQGGFQYANEWGEEPYEDRWSGVIALQGIAPYKFELDNSLYVSEDADVTFEFEAEYNVRITQRLVLQPRFEGAFSAQDVSERNLGAGMTAGNVDMRLRYEFLREFAPYVGVRYGFLVAETKDIAERMNESTEQWQFLSGVRFAF